MPVHETDVRVKTVPALTLELAVAVHDDPPAEAVEQEMISDPAVHVVELVLGVTVQRSQVVAPPAYE